ncbi:hypothetical protein AB1Y20_016995 [Prymnesium parvum]|uniref:Uncharacterized protein n=1 Tax=Prymnesium parvum TaxID=97485 RepID=A0AB34IB70_PRYPA
MASSAARPFKSFQRTRCFTAVITLLSSQVGASIDFEAHVKAPYILDRDFFGYSMALSGDTLAVGAFDDDSCATGVTTTAATVATDNGCGGAGAVYVFTLSFPTWTLQAYVKAPAVPASDRFGDSVALSGDTLAVGAYLEDSCATGVSTTPATDDGCSSAGAVYVYTRSGTTWTFEAYVKAPAVTADDNFGDSLALSGNTLAVGAYSEDSCATGVSTTAATDDGCDGAGAAYVYTRSGTTWTFEAYVKAPVVSSGDSFGGSLALSGDTLAVGAYSEDSCATGVSTTTATDDGCSSAGAVYVYTRSGTTWTFEAYVKAPVVTSGDSFSGSVALSGDTLAVTAYGEDSCATGVSTTTATDDGCDTAGAAYVYTRSGTTWTFEAYVKAPDVTASDSFGDSLALSGNTLAVGAYGEDSCATGVSTTAATDDGCSVAGAAYVYTRSGTTWTFEAYVKAPAVTSSDYFGRSVALSGDTLAVGAYFEDSCATGVSTTAATDDGCSNTGAAYGSSVVSPLDYGGRHELSGTSAAVRMRTSSKLRWGSGA